MGTWTLKWEEGDGRGEVWGQVGETVGGQIVKMFKQKGYSCMVKKITNRK